MKQWWIILNEKRKINSVPVDCFAWGLNEIKDLQTERKSSQRASCSLNERIESKFTSNMDRNVAYISSSNTITKAGNNGSNRKKGIKCHFFAIITKPLAFDFNWNNCNGKCRISALRKSWELYLLLLKPKMIFIYWHPHHAGLATSF